MTLTVHEVQRRQVLAHAGYGTWLMARVEGIDGSLVDQASVDSANYSVVDTTTGLAGVSAQPLVVSGTIFDTLQTDDRWKVDATGYNVRFWLPGSAIPLARLYAVELAIVPASDPEKAFLVPWDVHARKVHRSA